MNDQVSLTVLKQMVAQLAGDCYWEEKIFAELDKREEEREQTKAEITALKAKLEELSEQKPYCYGCAPPDKEIEEYLDIAYSPVEKLSARGWKIIPLYASPKPPVD